MQLTSKDANMIVDFYPVKYADGTICNRLIFKTVTFANCKQSKRYINKKDMQQEIDSRIEGYGYQVTGFHHDAQLFNSALSCAC